MSRLEEINQTLTRVLSHESDRRPRLTKAHMAVVLEALVIYSDILEMAMEMPRGEAVGFLMDRIPNLTLKAAKALLV